MTTKIETRYDVLKFEGEPYVFGGDTVLFRDDTGRNLGVVLPNWECLGKPETITVTFQPGDLLNNEPRSDHPELDLG